ncbi:hypothetical protein PV327_001972 [Microctonus hyperodae]|nr:hypothetical protein PV327_001972 [Microctonus hyperodae]
MGSADSAGDSHHSGAGSCGLVSSLFPNSCRGRAEAFARRLHRRLTSLGSTDVNNDDSDETHYNEKESLNTVTGAAWLQSSNYKTNAETTAKLNSNHIFEQQPRHSPDSDLYCDFHLSQNQHGSIRSEIESPDDIASPGELDNLLVNPTDDIKINHYDNDDDENRDSESGYIFSSPLDASLSNESSNEAYFDPESSEGDKIHSEHFYDPVCTSESDPACDMSYDQAKSDCHKPPGRRRIDLQIDKKFDDTSESSSSINEQVLNELTKNKTKKRLLACSSEESLNDVACSSLDTTSPSHESLWSTFDDNTVSQDENLSTITLSAKDNNLVIKKSHSDSEFIPTIACESISNPETPPSNDETDFSNEVSHDNSDADIQSQIHLDVGELELEKRNNSMYSSKIDIPGALVVECMMMNNSQPSAPEEIQKTEVKLRISENGNNNNCVNIPQLLHKLSCSPHESFNEDIAGNSEELLKNDEGNEDEDEAEEEQERPQRLRRCSSLKTGKTPPGTPGRKKIVRFADVLGLDLADVRTFLDEIPKVPNSAFSDLVYDDVFQKDSSPNFYDGNFFNGSSGQILNNATTNAKFDGIGQKPDKILMPLFQQPGGLPNFLDLVRDRQVCLENVVVQDVLAISIQGTVRVRNLDFHKSVHIRYTLDSWRNFSDLQACYVDNSCDGFSDKFSFQLYCHTLKVGQKLEFAVRFQCKGTQYWDNNGGANYCFQCLPMTPAANYIPITSLTSSNTRDWSPTFY